SSRDKTWRHASAAAGEPAERNRFDCDERVWGRPQASSQAAAPESQAGAAKVPGYWRAERGKGSALHALLSGTGFGFKRPARAPATGFWCRKEKLHGDLSGGAASNQGSVE